MILRRLYVYLVSIAALAVLAFGLIALGQTIVIFALKLPEADYSRTALAGFSATVVVALPVWAIHAWFARRYALRDPAERASAIRRLYVYLACLGSAIGAATAIAATITNAVDWQQLPPTPQPGGGSYPELVMFQSAWAAVVLLATWAFHYRIATRDRAAVSEQGASATLRRWYMYVALFVGLFMMLAGAQGVIQQAWVKALHSPISNIPIWIPAGQLAGGFLLWAFHARVLATTHIEDDRQSTLRAVEGFIAVAICIAAALVSASQILYYSTAHILGVDNPGGVGNDLLMAFAQPASIVVVYGAAWFLIRRRLARDAGAGEGARQAGMRRFYTNLAALVSMAALAVGSIGVLGTLLMQAEAPLIGVTAPDWKDPLSLWGTLVVVGAVIWLAHWRQYPWLEERQSLSRRLYLWAALLGSILAVLGGGIGMLYVVFQQAFSLQPRLDDAANLAFGPTLAVVVVAGVVGIYHWGVLRSDAASRTSKAEPAPPAAPPPPIGAPSVTPEAGHAPDAAPGLSFELAVAGATEDDVHQALANLPPQASYRLKVK